MYKLICYLTAIYQYSKTIYYEVKGEAFYGKHLFKDRIAENMNGYVDLIKEVVYLGHAKEPPAAGAILEGVLPLLPATEENDQQNYINLYNLIFNALDDIEQLNQKELSVGDKNLIGGIAQDLQQNLGLLWRQITPYAYETMQERAFMPEAEI